MWYSWFKVIVPITRPACPQQLAISGAVKQLVYIYGLSRYRFPVAFYTVAAFKTCTSVYGLLIAYQPYYESFGVGKKTARMYLLTLVDRKASL